MPRRQLGGFAQQGGGMSINGVCGCVRALLDKQALEVRGEQKCRSTGKYRELIGLPEVQR